MLQAFTNEIGYHALREIITEHEWGVYSGRPITPSPKILNQESALKAESWKPAPFQAIAGNRKRSYNYSRDAREIISKPFVVHRYDPSPSIWLEGYPTHDYYREVHMANLRLPNVQGLPFYDLDNSISAAQVAALNNVKQANASLGAALAEARRTVDLFSSRASKIARTFLALKRGNFRSAAMLMGFDKRSIKESQGRGLAALWLEYAYGFAPVAQDLHESCEVVLDYLKTTFPLQGTGTAKWTHTGHESDPDRFYDVTSTQSGSVKTVLGATVESRALASLNNAGLLNPASIAWELFPWSFAIDWFMPVGQVLEACTAAVGLTPNGGQTTYRIDGQVTIKARQGKMLNGSEKVVSSGDLTDKGFNFKRIAHTNWPMPSLFVDTTPFSTPRAINALALTRQLT